MGCQKTAAIYLNVLNVLMLLISIAVVAYCGYLASELDDFKEAVNEGAIVSPLVFAAFFLLVSVLGVVAVYFRSKILLVVYLLLASVITFAVLGSGAALISFSGRLENIDSETVNDAGNEIQAGIIDFELAVFQVCCVDEFALTDVPACDEENGVTVGCFTNQNAFDRFVENFPQQGCEALEEVNIGGAPIVGDPDVDDGCGDGSAAAFTEQFSQFIADNIQSLGIANITLSVVMLVDLIATCVLLWSSKEEYTKKADAKKKDSEFKETNAPDMVNGDQIY